MADFPRRGTELGTTFSAQMAQNLQASSRKWGRERPVVPKPTPSSSGPGTDLPPYQLVYELPDIGALLPPVATHFVFSLVLKTAAQISVSISLSGQIVTVSLFHIDGPLNKSTGTINWYTPDEDNIIYDSVDLTKFIQIPNVLPGTGGVLGCNPEMAPGRLSSGKPNGLLFHGGTFIEQAALRVDLSGTGIGTVMLAAGENTVMFDGRKAVACDPLHPTAGSGYSVKNSSFHLFCTANVPL